MCDFLGPAYRFESSWKPHERFSTNFPSDDQTVRNTLLKICDCKFIMQNPVNSCKRSLNQLEQKLTRRGVPKKYLESIHSSVETEKGEFMPS